MATAVRTDRPLAEPTQAGPPRPSGRVLRRARRPGAPARLGRPRALLALTAVVLLSALLPTPVLEMVGPGGVTSARLVLPAAYVALAPLCDVYDALSLLTARQHLAVFAWLAALIAGRRIARYVAARRTSGVKVERGAAVEARALGLATAAVVAFYACGALVARPMAALRLADRDELALDVHSHTAASHDGRRGFDAEENRRWHAAAGFDAAYITDHREYAGAEAGARGNPAHAGDGTVLLPGIETRDGGEHVNVLGVVARDSVDVRGDLDLAALRRASARERGSPPLTLLTAPVRRLGALPASLPIDAVEAIDGAPRGLAFTRVRLPALVDLARRRGARLVAGSDLHGWGRTAAAWTVVRVPGWRALTPAALDVAVRGALRDPDAVRVVARTSPPPPLGAAWIVAPAAVGWHMLAAATAAERGAWLLWAWIPWLAIARRRRLLVARAETLADGESPGSPRRGPAAA